LFFKITTLELQILKLPSPSPSSPILSPRKKISVIKPAPELGAALKEIKDTMVYFQEHDNSWKTQIQEFCTSVAQQRDQVLKDRTDRPTSQKHKSAKDGSKALSKKSEKTNYGPSNYAQLSCERKKQRGWLNTLSFC